MNHITMTGRDSPVLLSKITLGSCYFGNGIDETECDAMMDAYYEAGGRTLDTARMYACWLPAGDMSERVIGRWLRDRGLRREMTVVTKGGHPPLEQMNLGRLSPADLTGDLKQSLSALDTDYIDLYLLHRDDPGRPVSDIMDTLHGFVVAGVVQAVGVSNWSLPRILQANAYAAEAGKTPLAVSQLQWSYAHSTPADWGDDTLVCMTEGEYAGYQEAELPVMAFSPQAKGLFSKIIAGGEPALNEKIRGRFLNERNRRRIEAVRAAADRTGCSPAAVALSFLTQNPLPTVAVVGCSDRVQLADSLTAARIGEPLPELWDAE